METTKACTKCKIKYPVTLEYFPPSKRTNDGVGSWCRVCTRKHDREYQRTEKRKCTQRKAQEKFHHANPNYKRCYNERYSNTTVGHLRHVYGDMKQRCTNPKRKDFKHYGGRGIKCLFISSDEFVCYVIEELQVDPCGLTVDRINNNGHYERGNIRFVTHKENCNNRRI